MMLLFSNDLIKLYGIGKNLTNQQNLKIVHAVSHKTGDILKVIPLISSTSIVQLRQDRKSLWIYDFSTNEAKALNLKELFGITASVRDVILSKEIYKHDMLILSENGTYLMDLSGADISSWNLKPLDSGAKYEKLFNHSLGGYAALDSGSNIYLYKSLSALRPFYQDSLPVGTKDLVYSSKYILYFSGRQLEMLLLSCLTKSAERINVIGLPLEHEDVVTYGLDGHSFTKVDFSTNRTYVVAAIRNLLVLWKLDDVLQDELVYEATAYGSRISGFSCFSAGPESKECVWVIL